MFHKTVMRIAIYLILTFTCYASVPRMINYQGLLSDSDGNPVNGLHTIQFGFFSTPTFGEAIWLESHELQIENGLFNVLLGSVTPLSNIDINPDSVYLEITVDNDSPMVPRKQLVSVAFAFQADNSDHLDGYSLSSFVRKINNVSPLDGKIKLVAGSNVTITPDADDHKITIAASGGSAGDDLGNHTATQNIKLINHWLSNDGGNEGLKVDNSGNVQASDNLTTSNQINSGGNIVCGNNMIVTGHIGVNFGGYNNSIPLHVNGNTYSSGNITAGDRIVSGGHCGINFGGWSNTYALRVAGSAYCTGSWLSSDIMFKRNIATIISPIEKLKQLRGVTYNWKTDEYIEREFPDGVQYGLIAQEIEKVFPEMVTTDENGEKAVAYYQLIPVLLEALKQQQQQIEILQQRINQ